MPTRPPTRSSRGRRWARALGWAAFGAVAWGATLAVATPPQRAVNVGLGAALGGAAVGAAMGLLTGTFVFGENLIPTDVWWSLPIKATDVDARALPVLIVAVALPLFLATAAGAARRLVAVVMGVAACLSCRAWPPPPATRLISTGRAATA